ncbi:MAG: carbohydrate kinase [Spirochaetes bacterium RBG_16_67_19]|nr:MAG: carbohydrate kinase [Spirochaetes bacterium RBG_16_67_19]
MARVVSLGIHIADVLGRPVTHIPAKQDLALLEEIRLTVAGTAAGTAVDLAKLGAEVYAIGALGRDELGNFIETTMKRYGIHTDGLVRKEGVQTSATMLPIRANGERPALHVIGASGEFCAQDVDRKIIDRAQFLHIGGTPLMEKFDGEPMRQTFKYARERGATTTYDVLAIPHQGLRERVEACLPYVDFFMPGLEEALLMSGLRDRREAIRYFLDRGAKHTVFKMGGEGSSIAWLENGSVKEIRIPAYRVPVVDSTGCGDAYCAGFIAGLSAGSDLEQAGRLGSAAGALVIQGLGSDAGIVDLERTIEFMNTAETLPLGL